MRPQVPPQNLRGFSRLPVTAPKNRTRIGPHLGRRKVSLFSPKTGYVRRSEINDAGNLDLEVSRSVAIDVPLTMVTSLAVPS
jgi:hypothetical protein